MRDPSPDGPVKPCAVSAPAAQTHAAGTAGTKYDPETIG